MYYLNTFLKIHGLGWDITLDLAQKCAFFDVYEGKDRSINQTTNPPIIFSDKKRNLSTSQISTQTSGSKNVGYTLGKGELEDRPIVLVGNTDISGIERKELLIDLGSIDIGEVQAEGEKKLADYKEVKGIEGKIYQIPNMQYGKDWNLGDIVTVETEGYSEDKRITQVKEVYERGKTEIEVTFGDKVPGLQEQLKKLTNKAVI